MNAEMQAIVTAYEQESMTPECIAEDRDLDVTAVKACLMQCSSVYRKACGASEDEENDGINFTRDEQRRIKEGILALALSSEDEHLRLKALKYCRDDSKGRLEPRQQLAGNTFNVLQINQQLKAAREASNGVISNAMAALQTSTNKSKAIDV